MGTVSVSDALSLSDLTPYNLGVGITDAGLSLSDSLIQKVQAFAMPQIESISLTDSIRFTLFSPFVRIASDSLNLSEGATLRQTGSLAISSDTLVLSDQPGLGQWETAIESVSLSDAATVSLNSVFIPLSLSVSDTFVVFDSQSMVGPEFVHIGDLCLFQDGQAVSLNTDLNAYLRRYLNDVQTPNS